MTVDDLERRALVPRALAALVRRGADFVTAEDARHAPDLAERDHQMRQASRLNGAFRRR